MAPPHVFVFWLWDHFRSGLMVLAPEIGLLRNYYEIITKGQLYILNFYHIMFWGGYHEKFEADISVILLVKEPFFLSGK